MVKTFYYDEFDYCFEPDDEQMKKALKHIMVDTFKHSIKEIKGKDYKFSDDEIQNFNIIADLVLQGQFDDLDAYYDDLKCFFEELARIESKDQTLYEIEDLEYKIAKGMM